mmetsp:Transcript_5741/g.8372  ORF Transcript_5741/g.8372 Transcript_5741/m.8372 type:complete len:238 (+) Transcript_5741:419-1132(+)
MAPRTISKVQDAASEWIRACGALNIPRCMLLTGGYSREECKDSSKQNAVRMAIKRKAAKVLSRKIRALGQIGFDLDGNMIYAPSHEIEDLANRYLDLCGELTVETILMVRHSLDPLTMDKKVKKVKERVVSIVAAKFEEDICDFDLIGFDENNELFIKPAEEEVPPRPGFEKSSIARERERIEKAIRMVVTESPDFLVKNLNEVQRRALKKCLTDAICNDAASAHADTENSDASLPL